MTRRRLDDAIELLHYGFHGAIRESVRRLSRVGLTRGDHTMLYLAEQCPGVTVGEFVQRHGATKQAITGPLKVLVQRGLVELRPSASDGRVKHVHLTAEGTRVIDWLNEGLHESFEVAFARAGATARDGWFAVMRELAAPVVDKAVRTGAFAPVAAIGRTRPDTIPGSSAPVRRTGPAVRPRLKPRSRVRRGRGEA